MTELNWTVLILQVIEALTKAIRPKASHSQMVEEWFSPTFSEYRADLMPGHQRWSWCNNNRNKVHNKWNTLESSWNHPPPLGLWKNCLPQNRSPVWNGWGPQLCVTKQESREAPHGRHWSCRWGHAIVEKSRGVENSHSWWVLKSCFDDDTQLLKVMDFIVLLRWTYNSGYQRNLSSVYVPSCFLLKRNKLPGFHTVPGSTFV